LFIYAFVSAMPHTGMHSVLKITSVFQVSFLRTDVTFFFLAYCELAEEIQNLIL